MSERNQAAWAQWRSEPSSGGAVAYLFLTEGGRRTACPDRAADRRRLIDELDKWGAVDQLKRLRVLAGGRDAFAHDWDERSATRRCTERSMAARGPGSPGRRRSPASCSARLPWARRGSRARIPAARAAWRGAGRSSPSSPGCRPTSPARCARRGTRDPRRSATSGRRRLRGRQPRRPTAHAVTRGDRVPAGPRRRRPSAGRRAASDVAVRDDADSPGDRAPRRRRLPTVGVDVVHAFWRGFVGFYNSNDLTHASSIAYFSLLSLFPCVMLMLALLGHADRVGGRSHARSSTSSCGTSRRSSSSSPRSSTRCVASASRLGLAGGLLDRLGRARRVRRHHDRDEHAWQVERQPSYLKHKLVSFLMLVAAASSRSSACWS